MTGVPAGSAARVARLRRIAHAWDDALRIPGTGIRVGLDAIIGIVPGLGDAAGALVAGVILLGAVREGVPPAVALRMLLNLGVDALVGAVPVAGDLFDVRFRANLRNVALLDRWLDHPGGAHRASRVVLAGVGVGVLAALGGVVWLSVWLARGALRLLGI